MFPTNTPDLLTSGNKESIAKAYEALNGKDQEKYSIYAGNLVTDYFDYMEDKLSVTQEERAFGRELYKFLNEMVPGYSVSINKDKLGDKTIVALRVQDWGASRTPDTVADVCQELKTQVRILHGSPKDTPVGGDAPKYGNVNFRSLEEMAQAVNGLAECLGCTENKVNIPENLKSQEAPKRPSGAKSPKGPAHKL